MERVVRKLKRDCRGFSMVELLVVLLILLLVTGVIVGGLPAAQRAHRVVVDESNAQVLLSTVMTRLRDELGTATQVTVSDSTVVYVAASGGRTRLYQEGGNLWLKYPDLSTGRVQPLVPDGMRPDRLSVVYDSVVFSDGVVIIYGLAVEQDGTELAGMPEFCIRIASGG